MRFLRAIGKPTFILTDDVIDALSREKVIVNRHRGQIAAGAGTNAIKTIGKSWGHDRRRS